MRVRFSAVAGSIAGAALGVALGVGGYTFVYAKGFSYLTNNPAACANCHIMQEHYDGWAKASHHAVAVCNDCHTPPGFVPKYLTKAENGFRHSLAFTTGRHPDPLQITRRDLAVVERACRKCHAELAAAIEGPRRPGAETSCVRCHRSVGHLE